MGAIMIDWSRERRWLPPARDYVNKTPIGPFRINALYGRRVIIAGTIVEHEEQLWYGGEQKGELDGTG